MNNIHSTLRMFGLPATILGAALALTACSTDRTKAIGPWVGVAVDSETHQMLEGARVYACGPDEANPLDYDSLKVRSDIVLTMSDGDFDIQPNYAWKHASGPTSEPPSKGHLVLQRAGYAPYICSDHGDWWLNEQPKWGTNEFFVNGVGMIVPMVRLDKK